MKLLLIWNCENIKYYIILHDIKNTNSIDSRRLILRGYSTFFFVVSQYESKYR